MSHRPPIEDWQMVVDPFDGKRWVTSPQGELWTLDQMYHALSENIQKAGGYELVYLGRLVQHLDEALKAEEAMA